MRTKNWPTIFRFNINLTEKLLIPIEQFVDQQRFDPKIIDQKPILSSFGTEIFLPNDFVELGVKQSIIIFESYKIGLLLVHFRTFEACRVTSIASFTLLMFLIFISKTFRLFYVFPEFITGTLESVVLYFDSSLVTFLYI